MHVFGLDARNRIRCRHVAALGQVDRVHVSAADVFRPLLREAMAGALIIKPPQWRRRPQRVGSPAHCADFSRRPDRWHSAWIISSLVRKATSALPRLAGWLRRCRRPKGHGHRTHRLAVAEQHPGTWGDGHPRAGNGMPVRFSGSAALTKQLSTGSRALKRLLLNQLQPFEGLWTYELFARQAGDKVAAAHWPRASIRRNKRDRIDSGGPHGSRSKSSRAKMPYRRR